MNCEQVSEYLEAYVLDALEPAEQVEIQRHLAECPACRQLAADLEVTVSLMPQALATASPLIPPPSLKDQLLQKLADEANSPRSVSERVTLESPSAAESVSSHTPTRNDSPQGIRGWSVWRRSRVVSILIGAILLLLVIALGNRLNTALAGERALQAQLQSLFDQQELVLEVVDSDKTIKRVLLAPEPRPASSLPAYGKLYTRSDLHHVVAMVARLPDPPEGQAYHLWLTGQGQTILAGTLAINDQGFGLLVFEAATDGPTYETAQLTLQSTGSTVPSREIILTWPAP